MQQKTPIIFITQKETGMADQLKNAASGIVMFTGGEYNIGSVQLSNPVSIMGSGTDTTVLNGSIAYTDFS